MINALRCFAVLLMGTFLSTQPGHAQQRVTIELALATDISISVDGAEFALQMRGIANALRSPEVTKIIEDMPHGAAIALIHWSVGPLNRVAVPWKVLNNADSIREFANRIETAPRLRTGRGTGIGDAIDFSRHEIENNAFTGDVARIDISGDQRSNSGPFPAAARDRAIAAGITVNGLCIQGRNRHLCPYYRSHVIGGPSAFVISIVELGDFETAFKRKLVRELGNYADYKTDIQPGQGKL